MIAALPLLIACAAAWRPDAPRRFDLAPPPGWEVRRNARVLGNEFLTLVAPEGDAAIHVELVRLDARSRRLPADMLAETRALDQGRALGFENALWRLDRIGLDGHEAWAATGRRRFHQSSNDYTLVVARTRSHVVMLSLTAPVGGLAAATPAWSGVLESFRLPRDPVPDDVPFWDPDDGL